MGSFGFLAPLYNKAGKKLKLIAFIVLFAGIALSITFAIINFVQAGKAGADWTDIDWPDNQDDLVKAQAHYSTLMGNGTGHYVWCGLLSLVGGTCISFIASLGLYVLGGLADKFVEDEVAPAPSYAAPSYTAPQYNAEQTVGVGQTVGQTFCDNCGAPIAPGTAFCGSCGKRM